MLVNCLNLWYSAISASFVTDSHALLANRTRREFDSIRSAESIRIDYSQL